MLISLILAWAAVVCAVFAALKFVARISGNRSLNRFFHRCHIPFGVLLLVIGILHGILAGNPSWATLSDFQPAAVLFTLNWGTGLIIIAILLALTYVFRKQLKKYWMPAHRALTVLLILFLALHLLDVGIQLPGRLLNSSSSSASVTEQIDNSSDTAADSSSSDSQTASSGTSDSSAAASDSGSSSTDSSSTDSSTTDSSSAGSSSGSVVTFSGAVLKDGTYQGSADGYEGTISVTVTVSGGAVTDVTVDSESDSPQYFDRAQSVLDDIVNGQTLEVDTVSGATFSSAGLINAVADALQNAVQSGTLAVTDIDLSSVSRHGGGPH